MSFMREEILQQPDVLKKCFEENLKTVTELALVLKSRNIKAVSFAARGTSDHAAIYGKYVFEYLLGFPTGLAAPSIVTVYGRHLCLNDMLVIGISQSGMAQDVLEYIQEGKRSGAVTVGLTNNPQSPLANACDFHLYCNAGMEKSVAATKTFTTQLMLLLMLATVWADDTELKKLCISIPDMISRSLPSIEDAAERAAERLKNIEDCVVLSRGFSYPIALETALKVQETCYVKAKAYSVSDFYHGPIAIADGSLNAIIIAPESPFMEDFKQIALKLKNTGANIMMVTPSESLGKYANIIIPVPIVDEIIAPLVNATAIQLFACNLADKKGKNPDAPRLLNKITVTV